MNISRVLLAILKEKSQVGRSKLKQPNEVTEDEIVDLWIDAVYRRANSTNSRRVYGNVLRRFQVMLAVAGKWLDPDKNATDATAEAREQAVHELERAVQGFCSITEEAPHKQVATSTYNQRIAILSSFYSFAIKQGYFQCDNPFYFLERRKTVNDYDVGYYKCDPIPFDYVQASMKAIDRSTNSGKRDYALLAVLLTTGRRIAEVRRLTWADVGLVDDRVRLTFAYMGGKIRRDTLATNVGLAVMDNIQATYPYGRIQPHAPVWVSRGRYAPTRSSGLYPSLQPHSIDDMCKRRLGVASSHGMRHTFALALEHVGANIHVSISELQRASSPHQEATLYAAALHAATSEYADQLAELFGIE